MPNYVQKTLKQTTVAPGRHGRMYLGAYVPADFKHQVNAARIPSDSIQSHRPRPLYSLPPTPKLYLPQNFIHL